MYFIIAFLVFFIYLVFEMRAGIDNMTSAIVAVLAAGFIGMFWPLMLPLLGLGMLVYWFSELIKK
jgi:hypothetical protein